VHLFLTHFLKSISGYALKKKSAIGCFTVPFNKKLSDILFLKKKETELTVCIINVLQKMLQLDPSNRISAIAAMEHPYFDSLDKSQF
jgi:serine/threonine protein kinase